MKILQSLVPAWGVPSLCLPMALQLNSLGWLRKGIQWNPFYVECWKHTINNKPVVQRPESQWLTTWFSLGSGQTRRATSTLGIKTKTPTTICQEEQGCYREPPKTAGGVVQPPPPRDKKHLLFIVSQYFTLENHPNTCCQLLWGHGPHIWFRRLNEPDLNQSACCIFPGHSDWLRDGMWLEQSQWNCLISLDLEGIYIFFSI